MFIVLFAMIASASLLLLLAVELVKDSRDTPRELREYDEVLSESEEFSEFQEDLKWVILEVLLERMEKHPNDASKWDVLSLKEIYGILSRAKSTNVFDLGINTHPWHSQPCISSKAQDASADFTSSSQSCGPKPTSHVLEHRLAVVDVLDTGEHTHIHNA